MLVILTSLILFTNWYKIKASTVYLPYTGTKLEIFNKFFQCEESQPNIIKSVEECDKKIVSQNETCAGYLVKDGNYKLCKLLSSTEIDSGLGTNFTDNDKIYLSKTLLQSNIHISMDELTFSSTVYDHGNLTGTVTLIESDLVPGKVGNAIKMKNEKKGFILQTKEAECFCSFAYCNGKMSISLWIISHGKNVHHSLIRSLGYYGYHLKLETDDQIDFQFYGDGVYLQGSSTSKVSRSDWTFVVVSADVSLGLTFYINGIQDRFRDISSAGNHATGDSSCDDVIIGGNSDTFGYSPDASIDEIMYFYDAISAEEVFWQYMIYEGLDPILEMINNNNLYQTEYHKIFDGEEKTCINIKPAAGHGVLSLKMHLSSLNLELNVAVKSDCNLDNILLFGDHEFNNIFRGKFEELLLMNTSMTTDSLCEYSYSYDKRTNVILTGFNQGSTEFRICEVVFV